MGYLGRAASAAPRIPLMSDHNMTRFAALQTVQRTQSKIFLILHHVQVNHRRLDASVAEKLLHCSNICSILQSVRGIAVP